MKRLFLTSSIDSVVEDVAKRIGSAVGKKLVFITTASETEKKDLSWLESDRKALASVGFDVTDYTFSGKNRDEVINDLSQFDVLCVEGGNTFYLLEKIQQSNCADVIRDLVEDGVPYIGSSAGSIVAGPDIYPVRHLDDSSFPDLKGFEGLGLVDFVVFPHWGSDYFKDLYLDRRLEYNYNDKHKLMLLTDNQYILVEDDMLQFIDVQKQR